MVSEPAWGADPTGRHGLRWFDGERWTDQVADDNVVSTDPEGVPSGGGPELVGPAPAGDDDAGVDGGMAVGPYEDPDRYRLVQVVAAGGEGTLWKATIRVDSVDLPVAVKVMHPRNQADLDEWRVRWQAQSEVLRSLSHPNVVRVREVFEGPQPHALGSTPGSERALYLVMAWVEGETLDEWVSRRPDRDQRDAILIISKLAGAVDYLHASPVGGHAVLHRDIKPSNVIVSGSDVTLVDFGLMRILSGAPLTQSTGSPQFWAPEVALGQEYSEAADRYSLAATSYFLLTGTPPQGDRTVMRSQLTAVPGVTDPGAFADHVLSMLAVDPTERPASLVAWARDLTVGSLSGRYGADSATVVRTPSTRPDQPVAVALPPDPIPPTGKRRRRRWPALAGAVVILAGVGVGAFLMSQGNSKDDVELTGNSGESTTTITTLAEAEDIAVPDVEGDLLEDAEAKLEDLGFAVRVTYEVSGEEPGTVLSQTPARGTTGVSTVELNVAEAPDSVPDVVGQQLAAAKRTLEALGITVGTVDVLSEDASDGTVLSQEPAAGTPFAATVTLNVARRPVIAFLADVEPVEGFIDTGSFNISGKTYTRSLMLRIGSNYTGRPYLTGYDLARKYRQFRSTVGLRDDSTSGTSAIVEVFGDGRKLFTQTITLGQSVPIELDVTGVLRLQVVQTRTDEVNGDGLYVVWGDAQILGSQADVSSPPTSSP